MPRFGTFANTEEKALALTGKFEGRGGFSNLAGGADGQGASYGVLQWNLGKITLQPLLLAMYKEGPETFRRCMTQPVEQLDGKTIDLTNDLLRVCQDMSPAEAVAWAVARQDKYFRLQRHWVHAFKALGEVEGFRKVQLRFAENYLAPARRYMKKFGFKSERAFCLLFDICVQMGSVGSGSMARYLAAISDRMSEEEKLLKLAEAVVPQAGKTEWIQRDVFERKGAIARGGGVVHDAPYNLDTDFGVTMAPARLTK